MSKAQVIELFHQRLGPELASHGFVGTGGHYLRSREPVSQVIELQHSIYGGRVTANLGLDLGLLPPAIRWIARPEQGPHAHDSTRWIRLGMAFPERQDRWWAFTDETFSVEQAREQLGAAIVEHGLAWLERETNTTSFLRYAEEKLDRSRSPLHPTGGFMELRLVAAVKAWSGDVAAARSLAALAAGLWPEERGRLQAARKHYLDKHGQGGEYAAVPNLLEELEAVISTTKASSSPPAPALSTSDGKRRRSRSARTGSSPG